MRSMRVVMAAAMLAVTLTACNKSAPDPNQTQTTAPTTSATPAATAAGAPADLDPCQLVTQQEASVLTGAAFGPGQLETESAASSRCIYGANTKNVFLVVVVRAASVAEAQAERDKVRADAESQLGTPLNVSKVSGVGDDAEALTASLGGIAVNVSGLYVLKGTTGLALIDAVQGAAAPTTQALITQANTALGRLA
jgi:pectin methylesterase-like acyl-CoA thioesterase